MRFFPVAQKPWMLWVNASVDVMWAIATLVYFVMCFRVFRTRKGPYDS